MKTSFLPLILLGLLISCSSPYKMEVDKIIFAKRIYTVDSNFSEVDAIAIRDNKIFDLGSKKNIKQKYTAKETLDFGNNTIYPGFYDAHAHFYGLGIQQQRVDLVGTKSWEEVIERVLEFQKKYQVQFITGRGWDQNDWEIKEFPNNEKLNKLFPHTPIALRRIDGHALIANQAAIDLAKISKDTKYSGGEIEVKNGKLTGLFIDNPMELLESAIPPPSKSEIYKALKDAENICLKNGLTTIADAGLEKDVLDDIFRFEDSLSIHLYLMASATDPKIGDILKNGHRIGKKHELRSIKFYADGALGSRGACLHQDYSDQPGHRGALLSPLSFLDSIAQFCKTYNFQLNTHAIGDSANTNVLETYNKFFENHKNSRWRIEHAQVIQPNSFKLFSSGVLPSVQPTHATSDMYWAEERLGKERIRHAYAYKDLLKQNGRIALGTDFPIEKVNPIHTFYSAVARKDLKKYPEKGFQKENALSRKETLKGMTIWAAYSCFQENDKGSIEIGKIANFTVTNIDLITCPEDSILNTRVVATIIDGKVVYKTGDNK
jgi:predicted amidohydrolase YtcJ